MYRLVKICRAFLCGLLFFSPVAQAEVVDGNRIMDQAMLENLCALTFDDGPSRNTPLLLDMLAEYKIPATFFLLGEHAAIYPETVRRMVAEGHEIGNHSYSHPHLRKLSEEMQRKEFLETDEVLRSLGATPLYLRPPYGAFDDNTRKIADELGVSLCLWSMDSVDWKRLPDDYAKLTSTRGTVYEPGSLRGVFLFHDTHKGTVEDLPRIIDNLRAGGCQRFVTVSDYVAGIRDPEPPLRMTLRGTVKPQPMYPSGEEEFPLARCSRPWNQESEAATLVSRDPVPGEQ